ncbi:hypothetical protein K501DRAFT_286524, partial [Backusella circina FSU 941]
MAHAMSVASRPSSSLKQISVVGLVSMVAVLHSHIYWFYSVMYIAYNKMSPNGRPTKTRWRSYQGKIKHSTKSAHKQREKRLSVVSPVIPVSTALLLKKSIPILKSLETYPSAKKQSFDFRQFIKSERKVPKRIRSTGQMGCFDSKLQPLVEVPTIVVSSSDDEVFASKHTTKMGRKRSNSKRDKALILLRSTFQRNNSSKENVTSMSSDEQQQNPTPAPKKRRRRNTLLGITR